MLRLTHEIFQELFVGHGITFVDAMLSWLFFDPDDSENNEIPTWDFDDLKGTFSRLYGFGALENDSCTYEWLLSERNTDIEEANTVEASDE